MIGRNPDHDQPQIDLFRVELEGLLDLQHPMVRLARNMDWAAFEKAFAVLWHDSNSRPPLTS